MRGELAQQRIWEAFIAGKREAFSQLFFAHYELLYQYGLKITPQAPLVEDVIQDFFLHLFEVSASLSPEVKNVKAYVLASFRRRLLKTLAYKRKKQILEDNSQLWEVPQFELGIEDLMIANETQAYNRKLVHHLLQSLPPRQREIIYLKYYVDLSLPEIAETLSISYQVVANHLYRALKKLRRSDATQAFTKSLFDQKL